MLRLIGFLVMFALTAGGYMYFDYRMSARWAGREDADGLTFVEYLSGFSGRMAGLSGSTAAAGGLPSRLADMLPKPPDGWSVRAAEPGDTDGFLPKSTAKADKKALAMVKALAEAAPGKGTEAAALTYQKGDRRVVIQAIRYPNIIFTSFAAMQQRMELRMKAAEFRGTEFMTVRGLVVTEDLLPEGFRGRYFFADVGAQIHLRVLASRRMSDEDLVPFFQTLNVRAMNAGVIDKVEGLGEVPVIVLASALGKAEREAYLADLTERAAEEEAKEAALRAEAEAAEAAAAAAKSGQKAGGFLESIFGGGEDPEAPAAESGVKTGCTKGKDGVKRCTVESAAPGSE